MKNAFRFGSGADGNVVISGSTTLTRDMHYKNLDVIPGGNLNTAGYRVYVSNLLILDGIIQKNGNNASGSSGGLQSGSATLGQGTRGGNGSTGAGQNGTNATGSLGGAGGAGGAGSGGAGGAAGTRTLNTAANGGAQIWQSGPAAWMPNLPASATKIAAGTGGGSGGGSGSANGGGSGGGAGIVHVYAAKILGSGSIQAVGGNGANGTATNCGGGGGGGGGVIVVCSTTKQSDTGVTLNVSGGAAGLSGGGSGVNGTNGNPGATYWLTESDFIYGNGADGTVSVGTSTLARNMYYENLTINAGAVLTTAGFRIFVKNKINFSGTGIIRRNGNNGSGSTAGAALTANTTNASAGGGAGTVTNGGGGSGGTNSLGATGGNGGAGSSGAGGTAAVVVAVGNSNGGTGIPRSLPFAQTPTLLGNSLTRWNCGGGGGGGGGNGVTAGGGGGSGGGCLVLCAKFIEPSGGSLEARGGNGATNLTLNCGGGGGGGGGIVILVTSTLVNTFTNLFPLTIDVAGGAGGFGGGGSGLNGQNGNNGRFYILRGGE